MNHNATGFGPVWGASGVLNFFGEGYSFHEPLRPIGLSFSGATFVAKTTTISKRKGNMPLGPDGVTPIEFKPKCIKAYHLKGVALNAVNLSGPGLKFLLLQNRWQRRTEPFLISFMSVADNQAERQKETQEFVKMVRPEVSGFRAQVGLQKNFSCPNTGHKLDELQDEIFVDLDTLEVLGIPIWPKVSLDMPPEIVLKISRHPACAGIVVTNAIRFGELPDLIDWVRLFGTRDKTKSPLAEFGGGGLSGRPLLPLTAKYILKLRKLGVTKPINAGGGIMCGEDIKFLRNVGASSVSLGSISMLRPWRVKETIAAGHWFINGKGKWE